MRFEFATATRILFGQGTLKQAAPIAASFGRRALIVTGSTSNHVTALVAQLEPYHVESAVFRRIQ